jgi:hypothetical protein
VCALSATVILVKLAHIRETVVTASIFCREVASRYVWELAGQSGNDMTTSHGASSGQRVSVSATWPFLTGGLVTTKLKRGLGLDRRFALNGQAPPQPTVRRLFPVDLNR